MENKDKYDVVVVKTKKGDLVGLVSKNDQLVHTQNIVIKDEN